jgi:hypothetical protein
MRSIAAVFVVVLGVLGWACGGSDPVAASSTSNVIVVGAAAAPTGLSGFVIDTGKPGVSNVPLTCSALICFETIQLQNTGTACAGNIDGDSNVFAAPASVTSLLATAHSSIRLPNNATLMPGQTVSVNVAIPIPAPAVNYIVTAVLNWTTPSCPT